MSWTHQIFWPGLRVHRCQNSGGTVRCRDSSGHPLPGLNGDGKSSPESGAVVGHHHWQLQVLNFFLGQGKTDQASPILCHEIYGFRGHLLGSHTEITLIFPVLIIYEDDHPSFSDLF